MAKEKSSCGAAAWWQDGSARLAETARQAAGRFVDAVRLDFSERLGPWSDRRWRRHCDDGRERVFLSCLFAWAGHIAKADGRVSEAEIAATTALMAEMDLPPPARRVAVDVFTRGKKPRFPHRRVGRRLYRVWRSSPERLKRFLQLQVRVALADGFPAPSQRLLLYELASLIAVPSAQLDAMIQRNAKAGNRSSSLRPSLRRSFTLLGVVETATDAEIRRAYRRLIGLHHPDRLVARRLPDEEIRAAAERTREVKAAFEEIRRSRGF